MCHPVYVCKTRVSPTFVCQKLMLALPVPVGLTQFVLWVLKRVETTYLNPTTWVSLTDQEQG